MVPSSPTGRTETNFLGYLMHEAGNRTSLQNCVPRMNLRYLIKSKILKLNVFFMFLHPIMLLIFFVHINLLTVNQY
jgi:hypothetical protein